MRIDVVPDDKPLKYPPFCAVTKTRALERGEIEKQMKAVFIKLALSKGATNVLFVPEKDDKVCFCIYYSKLNSMNVKDSYNL